MTHTLPISTRNALRLSRAERAKVRRDVADDILLESYQRFSEAVKRYKTSGGPAGRSAILYKFVAMRKICELNKTSPMTKTACDAIQTLGEFICNDLSVSLPNLEEAMWGTLAEELCIKT